MAGRLQGKVAVITGTAGGQGRAAAVQFAIEGARVVGCDVKVDANRETVAIVRDSGGTMTGMEPVDLGEPSEAERWIDQAADVYGGIDVLYNNAGGARFAPIGTFPLDDWHAVIRGEVDTVFYGMRYGWRHLVDRGGGVIINTASIAGMRGAPRPMMAHSAAKAAVIAMTRQAAAEGGAVGIRANSISPGPVLSPATETLFSQPGVLDEMKEGTLLHRVGTPQDVAWLALYLASDESSFVTGANFVIDGGTIAT